MDTHSIPSVFFFSFFIFAPLPPSQQPSLFPFIFSLVLIIQTTHHHHHHDDRHLCVFSFRPVYTRTHRVCVGISTTQKKGDKEKKKKKKGRKSLCVSKSYLQGPRLRDFDFFPSCLVKREREKRRERRRERPCFVSSCSSSSLSTTQLSNVVCELMLLHVADCSLVVIVNCQSADLVLSPSSLSPPYLERRGEENERAGRWSRSLAR